MISKASVKKSLGILAVLVFLYICIHGWFKNPEMIDEILNRLLYLIGILFGFKIASGAVSHLGRSGNVQENQGETGGR